MFAEREEMKRLSVFIAALSIVAIVASGCGQSKPKVEMGKTFDHKLFSIELAKDWADSESNGAIILKKSETQGMVIMAADNNTETVDMICSNISKAMKDQNPKATVSEPTDITIGSYTYKHIIGTDTDTTTKKEVKMYVLATTQGSKGMIIQLSNLEGDEEQAMLNTLKIK